MCVKNFGKYRSTTMSDQSIVTVPDAFPTTDKNFFHNNPPTDIWKEIHDFVIQNIPGVDADTFTDELMKIRAKHESELQPLAKSMMLEGGEDRGTSPTGNPASSR
jgi:hypothetical protein